MKKRVMIYVQHLLGIGHLVRTARIAQGLAEGPFEVTVVSGGAPVPGISFGAAQVVQLPPLRSAAGSFAALLDADGAPLTPAGDAQRAALLLAQFDALRPHALLIELFQFGRRQRRFELLPLLARARAQLPRPLVIASIRDILQETRKAGRAEETAALVLSSFDHVLVHGDGAASPLKASFPLADRFADKLVYTGLVGPPPGGAAAGDHDVIVSAGGGAVGENLLANALMARPLTALRDARWLVITGPNMPAAAASRLLALAGERVTLARFVEQLPQRLAGAALSISQAGYNTVADVLSAGTRSVLVPFAAQGETEQGVRARGLAQRSRAVCVEEAGLTPGRLAQAIAAALALPAPRANGVQDGVQGGVAATRAFLERVLKDRC